MKKYLFGLGAMLVGAGLMFVLMHGEVSADSKIIPERFVCSERGLDDISRLMFKCKSGGITCAVRVGSRGAMSCFKSGGMFK